MDPNRFWASLSLCLLIIAVNAQPKTGGYDPKWRTIDSLIEKKGLTQSALEQVNQLAAIARRENNDPQLIKALVYRLRLEQGRSDSGVLIGIRDVQKELSAGGEREPSKAILQSILAGLYLNYLRENAYRIGNRTQADASPSSDIASWSINDLIRRIDSLYRNSLIPETQLWQTPIGAYSPVIIKGNVSKLRPTLFDLLAHTALDYYSAADAWVQNPAGNGIFGRPQAEQLYQRLILRHQADKTPDALIDVEIDRIVFEYRLDGAEGLEQHYMLQLREITDKYGSLPAAAEAWYLQAAQYAEQPGVAMDQRDTTGNRKAVAICEQVAAQPDSSEGKSDCVFLLDKLRHKELMITTENVNVPNRPFRALIHWRNFSRLYLRLIKWDPDIDEPGKIYDSIYWAKLLQRPVLRGWTQELVDTKDYTAHDAEIAIGALPPGDYALIAGTDAGWSLKEASMSLREVAVSRISFISQGNDFFVLDRENGQPLGGATVQVWHRNYNGNRWNLTRGEVLTADKQGHFKLEQKPRSSASLELLEISVPGDHYFLRENNFSVYYQDLEIAAAGMKEDFEKRHAKSYLFTDRGIYRPGQTVYFKGIELTEDADVHRRKPMSGDSIQLFLLNVNRETVDSLLLSTNEFGSYHGAFRLPENQLTGDFQIQQAHDRGSVSFSVEEYKRPKFFVEYQKPQGSYRVGDSIHVLASAKGYAGNGIDGAKVIYRITRTAHFRYPWRVGGRIMPLGPAEIQHGELKTDGVGRFSLTFFAQPDVKVNPDTKPEYDYTISADVTDVSGETRSGHTTLTAGYAAIRLTLGLPEGNRLPADSLLRISIGISNLSGEPISGGVNLAIYPLEAPQQLIRQRLWAAPDRYLLSEKAFRDSFPHDEYRHEAGKDTWKKGNPALEKVLQVPDSGKGDLSLPSGSIPPGWYVVEAGTKDKYGEEVTDKRYVELYDGKTGKPANPQYIWGSGDEITTTPGNRVSALTGSSDANVFVIRTVERTSGNEFSHFTLDKNMKRTEWPVSEADRGGFGVLDAFVRDNRIFTHYTAVKVPWTNKELNIRYTTYRDKTEPGSKEQWRVTIDGSKGEKVSAEVLSAMYDASLDQFRMQNWSVPYLYPSFDRHSDWNTGTMFGAAQSQGKDFAMRFPTQYIKIYDQLMQPIEQSARGMRIRGRTAIYNSADMLVQAEHVKRTAAPNSDDRNAIRGNLPVADGNAVTQAPPSALPRKDFRETAFFFPDLYSDSAGNVSFSFTMPEVLTTWKWMTLAHTRDLAFGYAEKSIITQKQLMVQPNPPRFLREGDRMELPVKIVNLTDSEMTGQVHLALTDPTTGETADGWFINRQANQYFTAPAHQSVMVGFPLDIPYQYNRPLTYRITAEAANYGDGEEATLSVVSNRMFVTESLPLDMPGDGIKHFSFEKLLKSGSSETLNHHALTVEFTANPAWYAVQALPYLMEFPYECAEQTFNRLYANALATRIVTLTPRLKELFGRWRNADTARLISNLQKNPELKSILLEETPWVLQGKSEAQQKKNIALLFDLDRMSRELESAIDRLSGLQSPEGGFPWFKGGVDDRYITQYILSGIGRLRRLNAIPASLEPKTRKLITAALPWLDVQIKKDYEEARAREKTRPKISPRPLRAEEIDAIDVHYLYVRSMFNDYGIPGSVLPALSYFRKQAQQNWVPASKYLQGMIALALFRTGDVQTAKDIIASLKQSAIRDEELGMYWKGMEGGYFWYQAPVETQTLLIEAFREIAGDMGIDRQLKTWLLRQKQTHHWPTTKATADACYALMLGGQDWLNADRDVQVKLGDKTIDWPATGGEAGTGYDKKVFDAPFVNPSMGNITVKVTTSGKASPAWGAVYWQYFDMLDRITPPGQQRAPLKIEKRLFRSKNTDRGPVLEPIAANATLKPGDKIVVRIVITADRSLEYVHMKDMRAACFEPVDVISQYKWQDGLGYYESTRDASTDFFFDRLPKGTHVFEYTLFAGQSGNFSNGVTSIECMYAPEFSFHSEGIRVNVEATP